MSEAAIRRLDSSDLPRAAEIIRESFATVAKDLGLTEQNCPKYVGFVTTTERLQTQLDWGWQLFGLYENERLAGYVSISKDAENTDAYELHNLAVLPEYRHKGHGKRLLDFCKMKVIELGGGIIKISITEENTALKNWYAANGFVHTGTKRFDHLPFTVGFLEMKL